VRKAVFLAVLALVAAGALALAGAGSAAKPASGVTAARAAIHAAPGVVRQIGARNYAGPNCPGVGWNCTTATRVLQVATDDGQNVAQCTDSTPISTSDNQSCSISQTGANNTARCIEHMNAPTATQTCVVIQTGAKNKAIVDQMIVSTHSSAETANQIATVMQGGAGGAATLNDLQLSQSVKQNTGGDGDDDSSSPGSGIQAQDAFQTAAVTQNAAGSGKNQSQVDQSQKQHAHGAPMQQQNLTSGSADCAPAVPAAAPNVCANVFQHAVNGNNTNNLNQSIDEKAKSNDAGASQLQGQFGGGIDGQVHQDTAVGGPGSSTNTAKQTKHQEASAPGGAFQEQIDPVSCCGFASQYGGTGNSETIHQSADLNASEGLAFQSVDLVGTSNTTGTCTFDQQARVNIDSASQSETVGPPCPYQEASIACESAPIPDGGIDFVIGDVVPQQTESPGCEAFPPENVG
jgi:hypothetical protein